MIVVSSILISAFEERYAMAGICQCRMENLRPLLPSARLAGIDAGECALQPEIWPQSAREISAT
jgi:hypothetical protein